MIFFDCAKFPFYFCLDHGKRLLFNVAIAAKGSALIFGYYVNVCIYLPSFTHCGLHGHCLVQKKNFMQPERLSIRFTFSFSC
jgi:hypothetical protein